MSDIRSQVAQLSQRSKTLPKEFVTAVAIMNGVQTRLSSLNYAILKRQGKRTPNTTEECLAFRAGICGNHIAAFMTVANQLGLRTRPVEFYIAGPSPAENASHICVEVYYDQQWHLFDVTWGTYFMLQNNVASIDQIRKSATESRRWAVTNESDLWYLQWKDAGHDPLVYVDHMHVDILRGREGTIHLRPNKHIYSPVHQPNFVGRNTKDQDYGAIRVQLVDTNPGSNIIKLEALGKSGSGTVIISDGKHQTRLAMSTLNVGTNLIKLDHPTIDTSLTLSIEVESTIGVGYVVYSSIQAK
ncbi:MAG: transglutaminase domain-containing protein [Planctomycetaceae bacterium]|nr:transglutaminase domain-containing protein [Planctomycetaceae bacterium]